MDIQGTLVGDVDLRSLALLAAIARNGSISAAGQATGISQQAASSRMRQLENRLRLRLLQRGPRGTTLTPDGEVAAEWAADVVAAAERFAIGAAALRGAPEPAAVAASLTVAEYLLPGWLLTARSATGHTALSVTATNSANVIELVTAGSHQLGFIESPQNTGHLASTLLARDELVVVVSPTHPWAGKPSISLTQLAATPLITREQGSGTRLTVERAITDTGHTPAAPLLELPTTAAIRTTVSSGAGPAVLSVLTVRDDIAAGRLTQVRVRDLRLIREIRAIHAPGTTLTPALKALLDIAKRSR